MATTPTPPAPPAAAAPAAATPGAAPGAAKTKAEGLKVAADNLAKEIEPLAAGKATPDQLKALAVSAKAIADLAGDVAAEAE